MCNLMTQTMSGGEEPQPSVVIQHLAALTPACASSYGCLHTQIILQITYANISYLAETFCQWL